VIVMLYRIRSACQFEGASLRRGDWLLATPADEPGALRAVAVWRSAAERDLALAVMGLKVKSPRRDVWVTANPCMVQVEMETV